MAAPPATVTDVEERLATMLSGAAYDEEDPENKREELRQLLRDKPRPICFDAFEPCERVHIAQGVGKAIRIKRMLAAGCRVRILVSDTTAFLNRKVEHGARDAIRAAGRRAVDTWRALGVDVDAVEVLWSSEEIGRRATEYWPLVLDVANTVDYKTAVSCCEVTRRRNAKDEPLTAAQFMRPIMHCADVLFFEADICHVDMDQEKVNRLAREYCDTIQRKSKPVILSYHSLPGLKDGKEMKKFDESSAIFMDDDEIKVNQKIKKAFCPPKTVQGNPCLKCIETLSYRGSEGLMCFEKKLMVVTRPTTKWKRSSKIMTVVRYILLTSSPTSQKQ